MYSFLQRVNIEGPLALDDIMYHQSQLNLNSCSDVDAAAHAALGV